MTRAIVSRCALFEFKQVGIEDIKKALRRAIDAPSDLKNFNIQIDEETMCIFSRNCI